MNENMNAQPSEIDFGMAKELAELEHNIRVEKRLSDEYARKCASEIRRWKRKDLVNLAAYSTPHKIPFKIRLRNFWNKLFNTL